jgi:FAD:protein FMN transferase
MELRIIADDRESAEQGESRLLVEIDRLNAIYSEYEPTSEFSQLIQTAIGQTRPISTELAGTLKMCEQWKSASHGAFDPATAALSQTWQQAEQRNAIPQAGEVTETLGNVQQIHWRMDEANEQVTRSSTVPLSLNAIAKGVILDRATTFLLESDAHLKGVMLNIGGDIRIAGDMSINVAVANPMSDSIGSLMTSTIALKHGAIATSGSSERFFEIAGRKFSHIIDPRSGIPVSETVSATVIANEASTADAVATICSVLSITESLGLVNSLPGVECMLITAAGIATTSVNWPQDQADSDSANPKSKAEKTGHDMLIEFEIAKSNDSRRYRRPYVAVWIEDADGFPVKTLSLFLMQNNPGPRWHRDLRRWYADDQMRRLVDQANMIETVSKPTRNPGQYKVSWDGKDDHGKSLKPGEYTILIEAAREHGTYQLSKHNFTLGKSFAVKLKPNDEISAANIRYNAN